MKHLWNIINNKNWNTDLKNKTFLLIISSISLLPGLMLYLLINCFRTIDLNYIFCITGYLLVIIYIKTILYLYNHEFEKTK